MDFKAFKEKVMSDKAFAAEFTGTLVTNCSFEAAKIRLQKLFSS